MVFDSLSSVTAHIIVVPNTWTIIIIISVVHRNTQCALTSYIVHATNTVGIVMYGAKYRFRNVCKRNFYFNGAPLRAHTLFIYSRVYADIKAPSTRHTSKFIICVSRELEGRICGVFFSFNFLLIIMSGEERDNYSVL